MAMRRNHLKEGDIEDSGKRGMGVQRVGREDPEYKLWDRPLSE